MSRAAERKAAEIMERFAHHGMRLNRPKMQDVIAAGLDDFAQPLRALVRISAKLVDVLIAYNHGDASEPEVDAVFHEYIAIAEVVANPSCVDTPS
jgi:hypothetical protein